MEPFWMSRTGPLFRASPFSVVEAVAHGLRQGDVRVWLLEDARQALADEIGVQFIHTVATGENNFQGRIRSMQPFGRFTVRARCALPDLQKPRSACARRWTSLAGRLPGRGRSRRRWWSL